jgi:hypothetical protein
MARLLIQNWGPMGRFGLPLYMLIVSGRKSLGANPYIREVILDI